MPPINYPSDSSQKKILKAFKKLGFEVLPSGRTSHVIVREPKSGFEFPVQHKIFKQVIKTYVNIIEKYGYNVEEFIKGL